LGYILWLTSALPPQDVDATPDISRAYGSPSDEATASAPPPYTSDDNKSTAHETAEEDTTKSTITQKIVQAAQPTYEELKADLEKAKVELSTLRQQAQLRLRKAAGNPDKPATEQLATTVRQTVEGVPVHVVAMLCFLTFLFAYLFF
jgi:ribosomal protein L29